ncbi:olfactory receptor 14C36-like [Liasis olivaceus]
MDNQTSIATFLLWEFSKTREMQIIHFLLFLALYVVTVTGNVFIVFAIVFDPHLHTPMYFFLMNLAMQDIGQISTIIPKSMINSLLNIRTISYSGCVAQVFFFIYFIGSDIALLTIMAYDRYVAICNPLQYEMLMNKRACTKMIGGSWIAGILNAAIHTTGTFTLPFCSNVVNQFFCEIPQLLKITCSDIYLNEVGVILFIALIVCGCFVFIIVTYVKIFSAVSRIPSVHGRKKALSTCLPHLVVFFVLLSTSYAVFFKSPSSKASLLDLTLSMIYSIIPPLLNPLIYSMRNKDVKVALSKLLM